MPKYSNAAIFFDQLTLKASLLVTSYIAKHQKTIATPLLCFVFSLFHLIFFLTENNICFSFSKRKPRNIRKRTKEYLFRICDGG